MLNADQVDALNDCRSGLLNAILFHIRHHGPQIAAMLDDGLFDVGEVQQPTGQSYPAVHLTDKGRKALAASLQETPAL